MAARTYCILSVVSSHIIILIKYCLTVTISSPIEKYCFINVLVYMPFQHDYNYAMFMECIGKISASIEDSDISNFIILGDFNSAVDTAFESELLEFCTSYDLSLSEYKFLAEIQDSLRMSAMHIALLPGLTISYAVMV